MRTLSPLPPTARFGSAMPLADQDSSLNLIFLPLAEGETLSPAPPELQVLRLSESGPLPSFDSDSPRGHSTSSPPVATASGIWLEGEVLMCACPDCAAPMTIRLWLMVADCWQCGTSIELTEEQERDARRLIAQQQAASAAPTSLETPASETPAHPSSPSPEQPAPPASFPTPPTPPATKLPPPHAPLEGPAAIPTRPPLSGAVPASNRPSRVRQRMHELATAGSVRAWVSDMFRDTPAWLISLVTHLVALTILGLLVIESSERPPRITISTVIDSRIEEGGRKGEPNPNEVVAFDLPLPKEVDLEDEAELRAIQLADQDARDLRIDPDTPDPQLPELESVREQIGSASVEERMVLTRDPRLRVEMVEREGGTTTTEAAVSRALRWLARHQHPDGAWHLDDFHTAPHAGGDSGGHGNLHSNSAGTSLALLPFLGAGQTHLTGIYKDQVSLGLRWLLENQGPDGDLRIDSQGNTHMYAHGQSAIVLCEAYAMTQDEALRGPAQKAIDFIVTAQHGAGGWRYRPGEAGDTSVVGWQVMALQSGLAAGLSVPETTLVNASHYLDSCASHQGARYSYQPAGAPTHVMTAEALLCRIYLGWTKSNPGMNAGIDFLIRENPPAAGQPHMYYWYYATQVMHHYGGDPWEEWNQEMREILVSTQETSGPAAGSWAPSGGHSVAGGRVYMTSLAACTLEVYYRHAPIFRQIDLSR